MALSQDETAVRDALHDLTTGQPDQPVDRSAGIRRRHVRRRSLQAVGAVAAVALAVSGTLLGVGAIGGTSGQRAPIGPDTPATWQLTWPERFDEGRLDKEPADERDQQAAVADFEQSHDTQLRDVRFLYTGTPDGMQVKWVVLEASTDDVANQLIGLAWDGGTSWTSYVEAAPPRSVTDIGFAWQSEQDGRKILALSAPDALLTGLVDLSRGYTALSRHDTYYVNGVAVLRVEHPMSPQTLYIGHRDYHTNYPVFFPEGEEVEQGLPAWQQSHAKSQGTLLNIGSLAGTGSGGSAEMSVPDDGLLGFIVRCAGPAPFTVVVDDGERTTRAVHRRCDGVDASVGAGTTVHRGDHVTVSVDADGATSFVIAAYVNTAPSSDLTSCEEVFADTASSQQEGYCSSPQGPVQIYSTSCPNGRWLISAEYEGGEDAAWAYEGDPWQRIGRDGDDRYQTAFFDCTGEGPSPSS